MANNIFQQQVVPTKPKVLSQERIYVYMPTAVDGNKGLASFNQRDFSSPDGYVSLRWPMEMLTETLADPTSRPSLTKVLDDEFIKTNVPTTITNPTTGVIYTSNSAEIKLNRVNRDATLRPDLVMLNNEDFEATETVEGYNKYQIKRKNPLTDSTIFKVNNDDFTRYVEGEDSVVQVNWTYAHDPASGSNKTNGFGLVRIAAGGVGNLGFDGNNNLQLDTNALKTNMKDYFATRPTYGETDPLKWTTRDQFIDSVTGLAKRDANGNTLLNISKASVGLSDVENRTFASRTYDEFGQPMKDYFTGQYLLKLDKSLWDGTNGLFRDWSPATEDRNTVQKWFTKLEGVDTALEASISALQVFLGFYATEAALIAAHPPTALIEGAYAIVASTGTNWSVRYNVDHWEWYDTTVANLTFLDLTESNAAALQPAGVSPSVGTSGKWVQSDHIHPRDDTKLDADTFNTSEITVTTLAPTGTDFTTLLTNGNLNIPYIRTAQYLHNWKNSPTLFQQDETSNEYYWSGTAAEFALLDPADIPNNAIIHVEDEEVLEPGYYVNHLQLDDSGIRVSDEYTTSIERVTIVNNDVNLEGVPVTLVNEAATVDKGERRRLTPLNFGPVLSSPGAHRMAITVDSANGTTLAHRSFTPNRFILSNIDGNLDVSSINPDNFIVTDASATATPLTANRLVRAVGTRTLASWDSGSIVNKPIVSNGSGDITTVTLGGNRIVTTDANGGLSNASWLSTNVLATSKTLVADVLETNKVLISGSNNTVTEWVSGGVDNSLLVRGTNDGEIKVRTHIANNRLFVTSADGTITELGAGTAGQYLVSGGINVPGWADGPVIPTSLPQTKFTTNPTAVVANALTGLAAVVLSSPPEVTELRNNCIYYY